MKTPSVNSRILKLEVSKGTATRASVNAVESRVATLTQGIQDSVSTHNTSPDSHADIRTLIAAKQNTLTISDVGTALLNISTPASVQIPRINADGSVTLIDVPSGGGGGIGGWITHAGPPVGARTWVSNGDANGVVYLAGFTLGGGTFTNPCAAGGPMAILRSSNGDGNAQQLTDRNTNVSYSANIPGSWVCIDLGVYAPLLESYSLQHQSNYAVDYIRTWRLQGTNTISDWSSSGVEAASWTDLDVRSGDTTISGVSQWGHWVCNQAPSQAYRYLRLLQDGANSEGRYYLTTAEMEFYGALSITTPPPGVAAGWLKSTSVDLWTPYYGDSLDLGVVFSACCTRTDLPWVTDPGAALLTAETVDAQRTALGMTAWAMAPWTDGTTSDVPEGAQLYFTADRANTCADARIAAQKGQADGLAPLDAGSKVPSTYLPDSITSFNGRNGAILPIASDYSAFYLGVSAQAADSAKLGGVAASEYSQTSHTHTFSSLTSKPTTLAGYGITDAAAASHVHTQDSISSTAGWITAALAGKQPTIAAGATSQYYRGDKTFQDFATSVRAAILTGLNTSKLSSREVLSTDSLLSAIGLLQGQLTSIVEQSYYAQAGDTKLEIPLSYTGTGTGVLTLRLLSDIAQTATIDGAGKFYSDSAGTLNESTSFAMAANSLTTFYIKVPSGTCNVTIPNGYAIRAFGDASNTLVSESANGPKINGLSTSKIGSSVLSIWHYAQLNLSTISGVTYPWLNATSVYLIGNAMTISGVTYPWLNAIRVVFSGDAMTVSGVTYPWVNATTVYFVGSALTVSGSTYPWLNATTVYFSGSSLTVSGVTYQWLNATTVFFSGNALTVSGQTYPWLNASRVLFSSNALTITANISTSALYSGSGSFDLYINGTGISTTYATSRAWPANISRIYLRPSVGSMPSADVDRLFNDLDATPGLTAVGLKVLDLRGSCGAVTAASATARANLAAKGFTVSFNV